MPWLHHCSICSWTLLSLSSAHLRCVILGSPQPQQSPGRSHSRRQPTDALDCAIYKVLTQLLMPHKGPGTEERTEAG